MTDPATGHSTDPATDPLIDAAVLQSRLGQVRVVAPCGSGVTACHYLVALEHAGLRGAGLYPGSRSEWCSDPSRAVAAGLA